MKKLLTLLALLALVPAFAFAQSQPPPGPGGAPWPRPDSAAMRQNMQQGQAMHKQFRANVLGALTPAHRNLLASIAGQLAVSTNPDRKAAVQKLDAALSSGEKQAILNAAQSFMSQRRAMREQAIAKMRAANPNMPSPRPRPSGMERRKHTPDAGALLLMVATGDQGPRMGMRRGFMRCPRPSPTP
ncbi:MAG TPA: hypothetical protein VFW34_04795 [Candidatus Rubrimentiphilum sp.]|nr:hypothetical protein [Candidatus Rubrimentiphilum sp.]